MTWDPSASRTGPERVADAVDGELVRDGCERHAGWPAAEELVVED
jgi:hypothetical protein